MAGILAKFWSRVSTKKSPRSIMLIGLDNSGKTSILNFIVSSNSNRSAAQKHKRQQPTKQQSPQAVDDQLTSIVGDLNDFETNGANPTKRLPFDNPAQLADLRDELPLGQSFNHESQVKPTVGYNYEQICYKNLMLIVLDFSGKSKYRCLWQEFYDSVDAIVFVVDSSDMIRFVVVRDELECMLSHPFLVSLTGSPQMLAGPVERYDQHGPDDIKKKHEGDATNHSGQFVAKKLTINQGRLTQSPLESTSSLIAQHSAKTDRLRLGPQTTSAHEQRVVKSGRYQVPILFLANKSDLPNSVDTEVIVKALNLNQLPRDKFPWTIRATSVCSGQGLHDAFEWLEERLLKI